VQPWQQHIQKVVLTVLVGIGCHTISLYTWISLMGQNTGTQTTVHIRNEQDCAAQQ